MDVKRSWPWKKKSSEKILLPTDSVESSPVHSSRHAAEDQDLSRVLADHGSSSETTAPVQQSEERLKQLNERLSTALMDASAKGDLVKQHAKVTEEAISGWERAEAEAAALRQQLDAALEQKLAVENRVSHLDGALKECMRELRCVREEQEQNIHDAIVRKTGEWDKARCELEEKLEDAGQRLLMAGAENDAMSKSLQDHAETISRLDKLRCKAENDAKVFKLKLDSTEKENTALKYEIHTLSKELRIRNEERETSKRIVDAANKQHLESVKKIAKLDSECQRLRVLVRKKLPGSAAVAHLKVEVEGLGKEKSESNRRSVAKGAVSSQTVQCETLRCSMNDIGGKDTEAILHQLRSMDEEIKMLKEALTKRDNELHVARLMCARTASKLSSVEEQLDNLSCSKTPGMTGIDMHIESARSISISKELSQVSVSEDGNDDEQSCAESWASALIAELAQFKKEKVIHKSDKVLNASDMDLMNDFIEMEELAAISEDKIEGTMPKLSKLTCITDESARSDWESEMGSSAKKDKEMLEEIVAKREEELQAANRLYEEVSSKFTITQEQLTSLKSKSAANESALVSLQEKLDMIFRAQDEGANIRKVLEWVRYSLGGSHSSVSRLRAHVKELSKGSYASDISRAGSFEGSEFVNRPHMSTSGDSSSEDEIPSLISTTESEKTCAVGPELATAICTVVHLLEDLAVAITTNQYSIFPDKASECLSVSRDHDIGSDNKSTGLVPVVHQKNLELDDELQKFTTVSNQFLHGKIDILHFMSELSTLLNRLTSIVLFVGDRSSPIGRKPIQWERSFSRVSELEELSGTNSPISETSRSDGSEKEAAKVVPAHEQTLTLVDKLEKELQKTQAEKVSMEAHLKAELGRFERIEEELAQLRRDKFELESKLAIEKEKLQHFKLQLHEAEQHVENLQAQLASTDELKCLAEEQLANMASSKVNLECQMKATEVELSQLRDKVKCLENESLEEHRLNADLEAKCQDFEKQLQLVAGTSFAAAEEEEARLSKERDVAAAAEKLAECQRTILVLGKELKALACPKSVDLLYDSQEDSTSAIEVILSGKDSIRCQTERALPRVQASEESNSGYAIEDQESSSHFQGSGRDQRAHQDPSWRSRDSDISDILDSELVNLSMRGQSSRRPMIDLFGDRTPVHADYIEAVAQMPSSPEQEPLSFPKASAKKAPRKKRSPRALAAGDISKSLSDVGSPARTSEKHGSSFTRFFSRNKNSN